MLALRLPPDIEERLSALAKATGRTKSYYAREAILEHLAIWRISISRNSACKTFAQGELRPFPLRTS